VETGDAEGVQDEGVSPLPTEGGVWGGGCAPSPENFGILLLKILHFGAFSYAFEPKLNLSVK